MIEKNLNTEIEEASKRIEVRQTEINTDLENLARQIVNYTTWAWRFVWLGAALAFVSTIFYLSKNTETGFGLNLLGDFMAGTVASVWSLAGLFFIYVAFLGQKQQILNQQLEIMYSQLEVKYTRLELAGQKEEMMEQNKTLRQQRFENTFFQLLRNHQDIVNGIDIRKRNRDGGVYVSSQGRDCFKFFYEIFASRINPEVSLEKTINEYMAFYHGHQSDLGHYFRNLYHILKFINGSDEVLGKEKFKYTSLLRALLSSYELALLFYNGLGEYGKEYFKPLLEKFSFLKNLDTTLLLDKTHKSEYDELAFASSEQRNEISTRK